MALPALAISDLDVVADEVLSRNVPRYYASPSRSLTRHSAYLRQVMPPAPAGMLDSLAERLYQRVVFPLLAAETREACFEVIRGSFTAYVDLLNAARVIMENFGPAGSAEYEDEQFDADLSDAAMRTGGEAAREEILFDVATFRRAMNLRKKLEPQNPPSDPARDKILSGQYLVQSAFHQIGCAALLAIGSGVKPTPPAVTTTFELTRGGALRTYAAVREAIGLRAAGRTDVMEDRLPFDQEDAALAGL